MRPGNGSGPIPDRKFRTAQVAGPRGSRAHLQAWHFSYHRLHRSTIPAVLLDMAAGCETLTNAGAAMPKL
jgi:hypothetical protein